MNPVLDLTTTDYPAEFLELEKRLDTEKPKQTDIVKLREPLDQKPELWRVMGDFTDIAIRSMIDEYPTEGRAIKESARHGVTELRRQMGYDQASQLERLLMDQVVICWLHLGRTQINYNAVMSQERTFAKGDYWERHLSASQRRFLRACETLARVQKMGPKIQLNIAQQQIVDNRGSQ